MHEDYTGALPQDRRIAACDDARSPAENRQVATDDALLATREFYVGIVGNSCEKRVLYKSPPKNRPLTLETVVIWKPNRVLDPQIMQ